jgi:hypothetical protein
VKAIKMFGLAALTALLAMAFVGASSAMAEDTHLCSNDVGTDYFSEHACTAVTHVHETSLGGTENKAVFLASIGNIECNVLYLGDVSSTGAPLIIKGSFTYTNCALGGGSCATTEENGPAKTSVLKTGHETAEVTFEYLIHLVCSGFIDCSYTAIGLKATAKGPLLSTQKNGEVTLSEQSLTKEVGGFLCPKISRLDITTTPLSETYIAGGLHYCVEYEHNTNGFYKDSKCTEGPAAGRAFDLVVGPTGGVVGQTVCVRVPQGLWLERINGECRSDTTLTGGLYEKGIIRTVQ